MDVDPDTKLDLNLSKITQKLATTLVFWTILTWH
jgi:hypothetical protein